MKITAQKKLLIYKILLFLFAFVVAFMPTTASRSKEVNSRVIVEILGIDGGDNGVEITAQYIMPTETDGATSKDAVTVEGTSLTEAVENLNTALGRRAELGHCSLVVAGEDAAPELFGTLMTATDVTADVHLCAAEKSAKELVADITAFMKKTAATDADFIAYSAKRAHIATNTLLGFLSDLGSYSQTSYLPVVQMLQGDEQSGGGSGGNSGNGSDGGSGESESGGGGSGQSGESGGEKKESDGMTVEQLALYDRDGRAGVLPRHAARGVAWVSAPVEKGIVVADVNYDGETVKAVSARLLKKCAHIKINHEDKSATVKLKATLEPNGDKFNVLDEKNAKAASDAVRDGFVEVIKRELSAAFESGKALGCDPLFIGRQFYRFAPECCKSLDLNEATVYFDVDVIIK